MAINYTLMPLVSVEAAASASVFTPCARIVHVCVDRVSLGVFLAAEKLSERKTVLSKCLRAKSLVKETGDLTEVTK